MIWFPKLFVLSLLINEGSKWGPLVWGWRTGDGPQNAALLSASIWRAQVGCSNTGGGAGDGLDVLLCRCRGVRVSEPPENYESRSSVGADGRCSRSRAIQKSGGVTRTSS